MGRVINIRTCSLFSQPFSGNSVVLLFWIRAGAFDSHTKSEFWVVCEKVAETSRKRMPGYIVLVEKLGMETPHFCHMHEELAPESIKWVCNYTKHFACAKAIFAGSQFLLVTYFNCISTREFQDLKRHNFKIQSILCTVWSTHQNRSYRHLYEKP